MSVARETLAPPAFRHSLSSLYHSHLDTIQINRIQSQPVLYCDCDCDFLKVSFAIFEADGDFNFAAEQMGDKTAAVNAPIVTGP